jgi:pyruvate dehydrogenase E1 component
MALTRETITYLETIEERLRWISSWMIYNANTLRESRDGLKVGGHQASCASLSTIMSVLWFHTLRPEDRVAVKPHAGPVLHAAHYLMGRQNQKQLEKFRAFGGAQAYPSRTKDKIDVDFSTGSVGLGVAVTAFAAMVQDYLQAKGLGQTPGRMIALAGDAEFDEGNIQEALQEGQKHNLRNCWWVVDYNRQSLDGVISEGISTRLKALFETYDWDVVELKYGRQLEAAFREPGGTRLRDWIDACPNDLYSSLTFQKGAAWRKQLEADFAGDNEILAQIGARDDTALAALMTNLGGHDAALIAETFEGIDHDRPVAFIAYTVKGYGLPLAGHKDNHSGQLNTAQMDALRQDCNVREGQEWASLEGVANAADLQRFIANSPMNVKARRHVAEAVPVPASLAVSTPDEISSQAGFGRILAGLAKSDHRLAERIVSMSPDVSVSTNLGAWINARGLFGRREKRDVFADQKVLSAQKWHRSATGQHLELGIAENNLFTLLAAAGLSHSLFGERLLPIGTLYDPFIARGLDALNYACYQGARFMLVSTPSGVTLAPEGGAHQSIGTPLIGISQDGLACFDPTFVDELEVIMRWSFDYLQRDGGQDVDEQNWLRDETGGSVCLRLSTLAVEQPKRQFTSEEERHIIDGAYWLRPPGPACDVAIVYSGVIGPEAIKAAGMLAEARRNVAVLAVTSADRLTAGWHAAERARQRGQEDAHSHIELLLEDLPRDAGIVTVLDGHPTALSWIGSIHGQRVKPLGVEHFGQSGDTQDLYYHFGIDANAIAHAAQAVTPGRPIRNLRALADSAQKLH